MVHHEPRSDILFISNGADVKRQNGKGETPLYKACSHYDTSEETIQRLVKHGADPNALDKFGRSPLDKACECASIKVIQCLVASGATVKAHGDLGYHPLHSVCKRDRDLCDPTETVEIMDYIMSLSEPDILTVECQKPAHQSREVTPLHLAIRAKSWVAVRHLQVLSAELTDLESLSFDLWLCAADARRLQPKQG
jgi:hypothetical protein